MGFRINALINCSIIETPYFTRSLYLSYCQLKNQIRQASYRIICKKCAIIRIKSAYDILFRSILIIIFLNQMHKQVPLSIDQIQQLKSEINKIEIQYLTSFPSQFNKDSALQTHLHSDSLFQYSLRQHQRLTKQLSNVLQFATNILINFQVLWRQVSFKDVKLEVLTQIFASATAYIEELKEENWDLKIKLAEAEHYINQLQQQNQYLDVLLKDRQISKSIILDKSVSTKRCTSENGQKWKKRLKDGFNFEKVIQYMNGLREQRNYYENQLFMLQKRESPKHKQPNKTSLEFLDGINRSLQFPIQREGLDFSMNFSHFSRNGSSFLNKQNVKTNKDLSTSILQQNHISTQINDLEKQDLKYFTFRKMNDSLWMKVSQSKDEQRLSGNKQRKDAEIQTESHFVDYQTAETRTQNNYEKSNYKQYSISIYINAQGNQNEELQKQVSTANAKTPNSETNSSVKEILEYFCQRWVSNRIKKYYFQNPGFRPIHLLYKK